jgi:LPS-assembly protein
VLNAGYRYTRDILGALQPGVGQVDISGQWPLVGDWHGVGRYNYSTKDHRVVETLGGLEYDGGCWVARVVVQRLATQAQNSNTAMFLQLELNDFSRIGSNPLELLKRNIPGYGNINQPNFDPAFMSN